MLVTAYLSFLVLLALCLGLELSACRAQPRQAAHAANPVFRSFQTLFLRGYLLALWADWLQGPYLYKLYRHYNFLESQIAILYVFGLASCILFAPVASWLPLALGRRRTCLLFCAAYAACCLTKLSRDYFVLILGRVLGGLSTSLLATAFEAWYVQRHLEAHDFPREWIPATFSRAATWNHGLAVAAGLVANLLAEWLGWGPVAPFLAAVPALGLCGWVVLHEWGREEAEGGEGRGALAGSLQPPTSSLSPPPPPLPLPGRARFWRGCLEGLRCLLADRRVLLLGGVQAAFESVLYIFVFLWTPVLDPHGPPLGIVFSCFMAASMAGSSLYRLATSARYRLQPVHLLCLAVLTAFFALFMLTFSTAPGQARPRESFLAFLLLELACGLYFPAVGFLQGRVIPEERRAGVLAWFRLPLHLLACLGLLALHGEVSAPGGEGEAGGGTRHMFAGCAGMMLAALLAGVSLFTLGRQDAQLRLEGGGPAEGGRGEGEL
ncbi:molybdate-anion transporter [Lepisosteus oculatus]|uniref:Molybdate-anion transporter n=1 Tax=Lepisosteus oculatus TaxID=7918 RepID=W5NNU8_LEPOC|nr:PREDICTED: molybdate-anion transporter [Lepisosteus oculatus]XP_015199798.1 PREDICTED: molybdate-anion transporter [Lepisosteus oculatus]XP_015199799.1 PREDICTED: molybdate-anion transporter [Lepisosteus oculatus]